MNQKDKAMRDKAKPLGEILERMNSHFKNVLYMEETNRKMLCVFVAYCYIEDKGDVTGAVKAELKNRVKYWYP